MRMDRDRADDRGRPREPPARATSWPTSSTASARSAPRAASRAPSCASAAERRSRPRRELADGRAPRRAGRSRRPGLDPATRTFQALRIRVNGELDGLPRRSSALAALPRARRPPRRDRLPQPRGPRRSSRPSARSRGAGLPLLTRKPRAPERGRDARATPAPRSARLRALARGRPREGRRASRCSASPSTTRSVVREVDPRSRREIWWLILLVSRARRWRRPLRLAAPPAPPRRPGERRSSPARRSGCSRRTASCGSRRPPSRTCGRVETIATRDLGLAGRPRPRSPSSSRCRARRAPAARAWPRRPAARGRAGTGRN